MLKVRQNEILEYLFGYYNLLVISSRFIDILYSDKSNDYLLILLLRILI